MENKRNKNFEYKITKSIINRIKFLINEKELISYKELCKKLNWTISKGDTKQKQLQILEQEFEFEYVGEHSHKKFLFTGIKEKNILTKPLTNKSGDYTIIDVIIMEYLNINKINKLEGSLIKICQKLNIIHKNLLLTSNNIIKVTILLNDNTSFVFESPFLKFFIKETTKKIREFFKRSIERLEKNGYIKVEKETYVKFINTKYPFPASKEICQKKIQAKNDTLKKLGYSCYEEVKENKKVLIYNTLLSKELKEYNIDFFYDHYTITKKSEKSENITINKKNIIQTNENIVKNFTEAFKNKFKEENYNYLSSKFLIDNLIDIKSKLNIKDMLSELENEDEE